MDRRLRRGGAGGSHHLIERPAHAVGVVQVQPHAAGLALVDDARRGDLQGHREADLPGQIDRLGRRRRQGHPRHANAVGGQQVVDHFEGQKAAAAVVVAVAVAAVANEQPVDAVGVDAVKRRRAGDVLVVGLQGADTLRPLDQHGQRRGGPFREAILRHAGGAEVLHRLLDHPLTHQGDDDRLGGGVDDGDEGAGDAAGRLQRRWRHDDHDAMNAGIVQQQPQTLDILPGRGRGQHVDRVARAGVGRQDGP